MKEKNEQSITIENVKPGDVIFSLTIISLGVWKAVEIAAWLGQIIREYVL